MKSERTIPVSSKNRIHEIIVEADTPSGKAFDIVLILVIIASVFVVMLDSVHAISIQYGRLFIILEWIFTVLFTCEYFLRIYSVGKPFKYITSFFGVIDLLAIVPTYLSLILPMTKYMITLRILRLLRIFRVMKLIQYIAAADTLMVAMRNSRRKILVFLLTVMIMVIVFGSAMYIIEGESSGFTSIPRSIYWAVVTLTTVGYGDISPVTALGQFIAAIIMIIGYAIIAVPTGIVTAEMTRGRSENISTQSCPECSAEGHAHDAEFCRKCGAKL